jgi:preprotein translocase subunit SecY
VISGQTTYLPMRVNTAGVIPIIFAVSMLMIPTTIAQFIPQPSIQQLISKFNSSSALYNLVYFIFVFAFTFFYTAVVFNPKDIAERMKKHGGFILGIRPGRPTAEYLERIMVRITFMGALFLGLVAVMPSIVVALTGLSAFGLGGTSILIVIGVALDTVNQIEAQLMMRHYEGF